VFTARYALSPYIKQIRFVFKGLNKIFWKHKIHYAIGGQSQPTKHDSNRPYLMKDRALAELRVVCAVKGDPPATWSHTESTETVTKVEKSVLKQMITKGRNHEHRDYCISHIRDVSYAQKKQWDTTTRTSLWALSNTYLTVPTHSSQLEWNPVITTSVYTTPRL
jgi:hypothetical protein